MKKKILGQMVVILVLVILILWHASKSGSARSKGGKCRSGGPDPLSRGWLCLHGHSSGRLFASISRRIDPTARPLAAGKCGRARTADAGHGTDGDPG